MNKGEEIVVRESKVTILRWLYYILPVVVYAGIIYSISSISYISVPKIGLQIEDKILHTIEYFVFGFLLMRAFTFGKSNPAAKKVLIIAIIAGFIYSASDEVHQHFVPGRTCEFWDWLADALGIMAGVFIFRRIYSLETHMIHLAKSTIRILVSSYISLGK